MDFALNGERRDLQRDVLDRMGFAPRVAQPLVRLPAELYRDEVTA